MQFDVTTYAWQSRDLIFFCSHVGFLNDLAEKIASKYNWTYQFKFSENSESTIGNCIE